MTAISSGIIGAFLRAEWHQQDDRAAVRVWCECNVEQVFVVETNHSAQFRCAGCGSPFTVSSYPLVAD